MDDAAAARFGDLRATLASAARPLLWREVLDLWAAAEPDPSAARYTEYVVEHVRADDLSPLLMSWGRLREHELAHHMLTHWRLTRPDSTDTPHGLMPDPPAHTAAHIRALLDAATVRGVGGTTHASARLWRALWLMPLSEDEALTRWRGRWQPDAQMALNLPIIKVMLTWDDPAHDPSKAVIDALFHMPYLCEDPDELSALLIRDADALPWIIAYHMLSHDSMRPLGLRFDDPLVARDWLLSLSPPTTRAAAHFLHDILHHSASLEHPRVQRAIHTLWHDYMGATDDSVEHPWLSDCWPEDVPNFTAAG